MKTAYMMVAPPGIIVGVHYVPSPECETEFGEGKGFKFAAQERMVH
jgi:hypothetical protein